MIVLKGLPQPAAPPAPTLYKPAVPGSAAPGRPPIFASKLRQTIEQKMPAQAKAEHLRGLLQNAGVKGDEIQHSDLLNFAHQRHGSETVSRDEALQHLDEHLPKLHETDLSGAKTQYGQYTLPDREDRATADKTPPNYHELLIHYEHPAIARHHQAEIALARFNEKNPPPVRAPRDPKRAFTQEYNRVINQLSEEFKTHPEGGPEQQHRLNLDDAAWRHMDPTWRSEIPVGDRKDLSEFIEHARKIVPGAFAYLAEKPKRTKSQQEITKQRTALTQALTAAKNEADAHRFAAGHFGSAPQNILAHTRFATRHALADDVAGAAARHLKDQPGVPLPPAATAPGDKVSHIEEIQSDWHQRGREEGYRHPPTPMTELPEDHKVVQFQGWGGAPRFRVEDPMGNAYPHMDSPEEAREAALYRINERNNYNVSRKPPDAPFKKTWHELAFRRVLRHAADQGHTGVTWTQGDQQNDRYPSLSETVGMVRYHPKSGKLQAWRKGNEPVRHEDVEPLTDLPPEVQITRENHGGQDFHVVRGMPEHSVNHMTPRQWIDQRSTEDLPAYMTEQHARQDALDAINARRLIDRPRANFMYSPDAVHTVAPEQLHTVVGSEVAKKLMTEGTEPHAAIFEHTAVKDRTRVPITKHTVRIGGEEISEHDSREEAEAALKEHLATEGLPKELRGDEMRVGGHGMRGFYDKILVDYANKLGKQYGVKVGKTTLAPVGRKAATPGHAHHVVHHLKFTPEMAEALRSQPQFMFSMRRDTALVLKGGVPASALPVKPLYRPAVSPVPTPVFASKLRQTIAEKMPVQAKASHLRGLLGSPGVKGEEIQWAKLADLAHQDRALSRDEVLHHIDQHLPRLHETMLSGDNTHYGEYALSHPEEEAALRPPNYHELLIRYKSPAVQAHEAAHEHWKEAEHTLHVMNEQNFPNPLPKDHPLRVENETRRNAAERARAAAVAQLYQSPHFTNAEGGGGNILAHARFGARKTLPPEGPETPLEAKRRTQAEAVGAQPNARRGLNVTHLEELQSDWHQAGREKGYAKPFEPATELPAAYKHYTWEEPDANRVSHQFLPPTHFASYAHGVPAKGATEESARDAALAHYNEHLRRQAQTSPEGEDLSERVPDAPFKKTWHELAFRRLLRHAAEQGHDGITWTTGQQQADRYDLAKRIGMVRYNPKSGVLRAWKVGHDPKTTSASITHVVKPDQLHTVLGKELADKTLQAPERTPEVSIRRGTMSNGDTVHHVYIDGTRVGWHKDRVDAEERAKRHIDMLRQGYGFDRELSGQDLTIGGEGMKGFYDKILVDYANKLGRQYGASVGKTKLPAGHPAGTSRYEYDDEGKRRPRSAPPPHEVHYLPIPREWREKLLHEPQFMFSEGARDTMMVLKARRVKGYVRHEGGKAIVVAAHIDPRDPAHQKALELRALAKDTDTKLAVIWEQYNKLNLDLENYKHLIEDPRRATHPQQKEWKAHVAETVAKIDALQVEETPLQRIYQKHRWDRFYLVTNQNGHVHSTMRCATTFPTTRWAWLPPLSGASEREAVAEYGEKMCTVCFPSAPVQMRELGTRGRVVEAEAGEKDKLRAEREQKRAEKAAKNIRADGEPLRIKAGSVHDHIQTTVSTRIRAVDWLVQAIHLEHRLSLPEERAFYDTRGYNWEEHVTHHTGLAADYREAARQAIVALALRLGQTEDEVQAELQAKAALKHKKDYLKKSLVLKARLTPKQHMKRIQAALRPEDRQPKYQGHPHCLGGHCYVAAEALYHKIGREKSGYVPTHITHEGSSHWFLRHRTTGEVLDPTAAQFKTPVPYERGRGIGFQGKDPSVPSERARTVLARLRSLGKSERPALAPDAVEAHENLGDQQRGEPEQRMLDIQHYHGGGALFGVVEHVGDITHRMSHMAKYGKALRANVADKAEKTHHWLTHPYGFAREHEGNIRTNAKYRGRPEAEHRKTLDTMLTAYADAHAKLPVYNKPQWHAREAAVAVGRQRWSLAAHHLKRLHTMTTSMTSPEWDHHALSVTRDAQGQIQEYTPPTAKKSLFARLVQKAEVVPSTEMPMPEMTAPQHALLTKPRGGGAPKPPKPERKIVLRVTKPRERKYHEPSFPTPAPRAHPHAIEVYPEKTGAHNTMGAFSPMFQKKVIDKTQEGLGVDPGTIHANYEKLFLKGRTHEDYEKDRDWYHMAHGVARDIADKHKYEHHQAAGALAGISSGSKWDDNKTIAHELAAYIKQDPSVNLTPKMLINLNKELRVVSKKSKKGKPEEGKEPPYEFAPVTNGTKLSQMAHPLAAATVANHIRRGEKGKKWRVGHGYDGIAKAVRIYRGEHPRTALQGGKIRSFYNNILDPHADQDVTIDTHMINAAADKLLTDSNLVSRLSGTPSATFEGHKASIGIKPLLADVSRDLAKKYGLKGQEMQAIIWSEWLRQHPATEKRKLTAARNKEIKAALAAGLPKPVFKAESGYARLDQEYLRANRIDPFYGGHHEHEHHPYWMGKPRPHKKAKTEKSLVLKAVKTAPASKPGPSEVRPLKPREGAVPVKNFVKLTLPETGHGRFQDHTIEQPRDAARLMGTLKDKDREHLWAIHTDEHGRHLGNEHISMGTLGSTITHPREVFKTMRLSGAKKVWLLHNHPSGDPTPSREDIALTRSLGRAGQALGIQSMGHVVLGQDEFTHIAPDGQTHMRHPMPEAPQKPEPFDVQTERTPREPPFEQAIDSPDKAAALGQHFFHPTHPSVVAAYLDSQNKINGIEHVADGELETADPMQGANHKHIEAAVLRAAHGALRHNAASVVFMSNVHHPHTVPNSKGSVPMNQFHKAAHELLKQKLGINLHDHVHVAPGGSYASMGMQGALMKGEPDPPPVSHTMDFQGFPISIETAIGDGRHWHNKETGEDGHTAMTLPYGYIRGTLGMDGEALDVFVGPDDQAPLAYIVTTNKAPDFTRVDEQKVFLGFRRQADATEAFSSHYDDPRFMHSVTAMPLDEFRTRLKAKQYRGKALA